MPRGPARKSATKIVEGDTSDAVATPKKGRQSVKIETTEVVAKETVSPSKTPSRKAKKEIKYEEEEEDSEEETFKPNINRVKAKTVVKEETPKPKKAPAKRKAKAEDEEDENADDTKFKKKRKTKEEKEAEAMPLAARTVVSTLKKAMHIGAHVSAAGGNNPHLLSI
jgi:AP endonuclease-1